MSSTELEILKEKAEALEKEYSIGLKKEEKRQKLIKECKQIIMSGEDREYINMSGQKKIISGVGAFELIVGRPMTEGEFNLYMDKIDELERNNDGKKEITYSLRQWCEEMGFVEVHPIRKKDNADNNL